MLNAKLLEEAEIRLKLMLLNKFKLTPAEANGVTQAAMARLAQSNGVVTDADVVRSSVYQAVVTQMQQVAAAREVAPPQEDSPASSLSTIDEEPDSAVLNDDIAEASLDTLASYIRLLVIV